MDRSSSELCFKKFLEVAEEAAPMANGAYDKTDNNCKNRGDSSKKSEIGANEEVIEINERPPSDQHPMVAVDPGEYAVMLKRKLDIYCVAVAKSMGSSLNLQDSPPLADNSNASQLISPASSNGACITKPANSCSSKEGSDEYQDDLEGETETLDNVDPTNAKRMRRMLSNRESARRSRKRKQVHLNELEAEVLQLRVEKSSLLKRLTHITRNYNEASVDNRVLKADVETLRAKVKMAEDTVKRVTGTSQLHFSFSDMSAMENIPFPVGPTDNDATDNTVPTEEYIISGFFNEEENSHKIKRGNHIGEPGTPVVAANGSSSVKTARNALMKRVASLEHLQKRIFGGPSEPV